MVAAGACRGGGLGPTPSSSAPPGNGPWANVRCRDPLFWSIMPSCLALCLFLCLGSFCVATTICGHVCSTGLAKSRTHSLGVSVICSASCVVIAPLEAVALVGGSSDPSVPRSPGVTLQEKAGRSMGPSTLRCEFPWEVVVVYVGLLFWLFRFLSVLCEAVVHSQGSVFVFVPLSPSRPDPCLLFNSLSSSFLFLSGTFIDSVSLSLSLFLSHALGKPKPFWFGVPFVFSWPRSRTSTLPRDRHLLPGHLPHLFFCSDAARLSGGGWSWLGVVVLVVLGFLACCCECIRYKR